MNPVRRIWERWAFCGIAMLASLSYAGGLRAQDQGYQPDNRDLQAPEVIPNQVTRPRALPKYRTARAGSRFVPQWQETPRPRHRTLATPYFDEQAPQEANIPLEALEEGETLVPQPETIEPGLVEPGVEFDVESDVEVEPNVEFEIDEFGGWDPEEETYPGAYADGDCQFGDCPGDCQFGDCGPGQPPGHYCDGICIPRRLVDETSLFSGTQGFKGPLDLGRNGNFGLHEGVQFAGPIGWRLGLGHLGLGYQVGAQFVHSNFSGDQVVGVGEDQRDQSFLTAGLFHRAFRGQGWQYGLVFDSMRDNYYVDLTLAQIRTEISFLTPSGHEVGFWGAFGTRDDQDFVNGVLQTYEPTDLYAVFYRRNLRTGGQGRIWIGGTGSRDGLLGADFRVPLSNRWDFTGAANYLIPEESSGREGSAEESWGLAMNLVWYPFRRRCGVHNGPFRSLFPLADNTVFMVDRVDR